MSKNTRKCRINEKRRQKYNEMQNKGEKMSKNYVERKSGLENRNEWATSINFWLQKIIIQIKWKEIRIQSEKTQPGNEIKRDVNQRQWIKVRNQKINQNK